MFFEKDEDILKRIIDNDQKALESLYHKYYLSLCDFAFSYVKSIDFAEEVVSDVFLNIWMNRCEIHIKTSIKSYLFTSVKNQSINFLNSQKVNFEDIEILERKDEFSDYNADSHLNYSEMLTEVERIIEQLPPQRRIIFKLNRIDGLKYKEIADLLSISVHTVQKQMTEAVKHISRSYADINLILFCLADKSISCN